MDMPEKITIQRGDTLSGIAQTFGIPISELAKANNIKDINKIFAGQTLVLPTKKQKKSTQNDESFLPIAIRQFFNPNQDRTEKDFSKAERDALKKVVEYSQSEERIKQKLARGVDPNLIEYRDYNAMKGVNLGDSKDVGISELFEKVQNPFYNLKTTIGRASVITDEDGNKRIIDKYDFPAKTQVFQNKDKYLVS